MLRDLGSTIHCDQHPLLTSICRCQNVPDDTALILPTTSDTCCGDMLSYPLIVPIVHVRQSNYVQERSIEPPWNSASVLWELRVEIRYP